MYGDVVFGVSDHAAGKAFFPKVLEPIGMAVLAEGPLGVELNADGRVPPCLRQTAEKSLWSPRKVSGCGPVPCP